MSTTPRPVIAKIGNLKAFLMTCPTLGCPMQYWRTLKQLGKDETCGGCREQVVLEKAKK